MPAPINNFDGTSSTQVSPPDTNGDVGLSNYVESVNTDLAIYDKSGNLLSGPFPANDLFNGFSGACETTNDGDAIIQYDSAADRWVFSQFANAFSGPPFYQCFAVSQTSNPLGSWNRYQFLEPGSDFFDYPKIGIWSDAYYMTANQFQGVNANGVGVFAFNRTQMLAGLSAPPVYKHVNAYGLVPSDIENSSAPPPAGEPEHLMDYPQMNGNKLNMFDFHVDFATPANSTLTGPTPITVNSFDARVCKNILLCIPQKGTSKKVDSLADLLMYQLEYYNYGSTEAMVIDHTIKAGNGANTAIRWYQFRRTTPGSGAWSVQHQGTYSPDSLYRWMPSSALDKNGNFAVGYSTSSEKRYPSIRYAGRLATDPGGQLAQGETQLKKGSGSQTGFGGRWGDYSSMQIDPSDGCTFWYTNEYYPATSRQGWHTRIGSFKFPSCT
jgi:hypothetical protein